MNRSDLIRRWQHTWLHCQVTAPLRKRYGAFADGYPRLARALKYTAIGFGISLLLSFLFTILVYSGVFGRLPSYDDLRHINQNIASEVYAEDGEMIGKFYIENRLPADLGDIPGKAVQALIATEDARFFTHSGVDIRAWVRVFLRTVVLMDTGGGGGSTLSQQIAKNLYPRKNRGLLTIPVAKVKEIFIGRRLERVYDKNQLIALYFNTVSFGEDIFGIKVASQRFFGTGPENLKTEEAALLIGMLKGPTHYHPVRNPRNALNRRNVVLQQMEKYGYLAPTVADSLQALPLQLQYTSESHYEGTATYFRSQLRQQLDELLKDYTRPDGRPYNLYTDGLKIYTTLDSRMQRFAEQAVAEQMTQVQRSYYEHIQHYRQALPWGSNEEVNRQKQQSIRYKILKDKGLSEKEIDLQFEAPVRMRIFSWEAPGGEKDTLLSPLDSIRYYLTVLQEGFIAVEPQTGKIKAWVGGVDFKYFKYDNVKAQRQVGSTFKPIVYAAALQEGIEPCERFENRLTSYPEYNDWTPRNADDDYGGTFSMRGALKMSVNTIAAGLIHRTGVQPVRELARRMGVTAPLPNEPGIALGSADISLYEMVRVFATFANDGRVPELWHLLRVETADGDTLIQFPVPKPSGFSKAMDQQIARTITHFLQATVQEGTGARLRTQFGFPYPTAGKTGTTNNNTDGWFLGYTPQLAFGARVGALQPVVHFRSTRLGQGSATALPICGQFLSQVYRESAFSKWRNSAFPPPNSTWAERLLCPDFIPADSVMIDSLLHLMALPEDSLILRKKLELAELIVYVFGEEEAFRKDGFLRIFNTAEGKLPAELRSEIQRLYNIQGNDAETPPDTLSLSEKPKKKKKPGLFKRIFRRKNNG